MTDLELRRAVVEIITQRAAWKACDHSRSVVGYVCRDQSHLYFIESCLFCRRQRVQVRRECSPIEDLDFFDLLRLPFRDQNEIAIRADAFEALGYTACASAQRIAVMEGPVQPGTFLDTELGERIIEEMVRAECDRFEGPPESSRLREPEAFIYAFIYAHDDRRKDLLSIFCLASMLTRDDAYAWFAERTERAKVRSLARTLRDLPEPIKALL